MERNKIDELIIRAKCLKNVGIGGKKDINILEKYLNVKMSIDFAYIYSKYHYEFTPLFDFAGFPCGVIEGTCEYRERGLPNNYIILADQGDAGVVLMETQDNPEKPSPVIWCDYPDIFNLCEEGKFKYKPDIWPSFADFFEYLVDEEEKRLNE